MLIENAVAELCHKILRSKMIDKSEMGVQTGSNSVAARPLLLWFLLFLSGGMDKSANPLLHHVDPSQCPKTFGYNWSHLLVLAYNVESEFVFRLSKAVSTAKSKPTKYTAAPSP